MYNYDVILTFEFQVYKGRDKENVINDNINRTSSGVESYKNHSTFVPSLSSTSCHVVEETSYDSKII